MYIAGIDENGLGPKLGPLVVTGALFEVQGERYRPETFLQAFEEASALGGAKVADSKTVMRSGDMALGENTVLAFASRIHGRLPQGAEEFLELTCHPPPSRLREACPAPGADLCFGGDASLPLFGGGMGTAARIAEGLGDRMAGLGIRPVAVESEVLCPARYNRSLTEEGEGSKARVDLAAFERRMLSLFGRAAGEEVLFLCGKVMNQTYYSPKLWLIEAHPLLVRSESREASCYGLQDFGEIRFLLDGDRHHPPIALASMFGKYVREIFMARLNRYFAERIPGHLPASGYGDPVTRAFIQKALPMVREAGIPEPCFLRDR
ncbi:MAG: hypothetical protein ACYTHM_21320 [Planctomycetota bacterium]|jgi:ribonuclease HII